MARRSYQSKAEKREASMIQKVFGVSDVRPVVDCPGWFVSPEGRVFSNRKAGRVRELVGNVCSSTGYRRVGYNNKTQYFVHPLVLMAFVGPPLSGQECRHLNGDKLDNRLENLRWGSRKENVADTIRAGNFPLQKLSLRDRGEIRLLYDSGVSARDIAEKFGVHLHTIFYRLKKDR